MTERLTSEAEGLFAVLRQSADPQTVAAIEGFVAEAGDRELCRINAIDFAATRRLDEERVVAAFLHAARLGIFELSWNVLCPGCGGVLDTSSTLKSVKHDDYVCALCAEGYQPTLDEMVEVTFTISRRVRKIAAHEPHELPFFEYMRQIFWASGMSIPEDLEWRGVIAAAARRSAMRRSIISPMPTCRTPRPGKAPPTPRGPSACGRISAICCASTPGAIPVNKLHHEDTKQ